MDAYWNSVGTPDSELIGFLLNPMFTGAPAWPNTRQAYRVVRTPESLIIASDGMSDPRPVSGAQGLEERFGFGLEVFIEVKGLQTLSFQDITAHWAYAAVENLAKNAAAHGGICELLDELGTVSIELPIGAGPEGFLKPNGHLGGLINVPMGARAGTVETPIKPVKVVPITILTPAEIDICAVSEAARASLAEELVERASGHVTDPARSSLR